MGLDIKDFRENPEMIRESQRRRFEPVEVVDKVLELDAAWRKARFNLNEAQKAVGAIKKEIGALHTAAKKSGQPVDDAKLQELLKKKTEAEAEIAKLTEEESAKDKEVKALISTVGNIVHESVPVSKDEADNAVVKKWGEFTQHPNGVEKPLHHHELLAMIDGADTERGVKVAGHRAYFLKGWGVKLNQAIIAYGQNFLDKEGYTLMQTPFFMRKACMALTAQLSDFDESLYHVDEGATDVDGFGAVDEKYLIATSEQPISALHWKEWLQPRDLPMLYGGFSTNFRKEAGAHGKDTWGIFRVHQFEKVEQFAITEPNKSWEMHEKMLGVAEKFYQSLNIPYHVVNIVSGALNNAAAKKYDLEAWFPGFQEFRELVSCSNCTDYQSRALEVRYGSKKEDESKKTYVHMLNSTLVATERALCCILENGQTDKGIKIPDVLVPFMGGKDFIPFTKPCPVFSAPKKK